MRAADPAAHGFDIGPLKRLDAVIETESKDGQLAGAVMLVKRDGQDVVLKAYGQQDKEGRGPAHGCDLPHRIDEQGHDDGRRTDAQRSREQIYPGVHPPGSPVGVKYATVRAKNPITTCELMTQTGGLGYGQLDPAGNNNLNRRFKAAIDGSESETP